MSTPSAIFLGMATIAGLVYWVLGIIASGHYADTNIPREDRFLSSGLLWSFSRGNYTEHGKKLCVWGNIAIVVTVGATIAWVRMS
jgi:hypothetical protein